MFARFVPAVLMVAVTVAGAAQAPAIEIRGEPYALYMEGADLSAPEALTLEWHVKDHPRDATARFKLASYFANLRWEHPASRDAFAEHYIWFVQNAPAASVFRVGAFELHDGSDPRFGEARELWLKQAREHADNAAVQANAAGFLLHSNPQESKRLLERARELDPQNPDRYDRLAQWHHLQMMTASHEEAPKLAKEQYRLLKRAQELSGGDIMESRVNQMAIAAMHAGETAEARRLAQAMIDDPGDTWNRGNRVHDGHFVLGSIALADGDVDAASRHLLESGRTPGSPQLNSFGPSMELAAALFDRGRKDDVLQYLDLCSQFWAMGGESLQRWREQIQRGDKPSFKKFEAFGER